MIRFLLILAATASLTTPAAAASPETQVTLPLSDFFACDKGLPLDAELTTESAGPPARFHVTYGSVHDKRVPALLFLPPGRGPFPAVLVLHGLGDHKGVIYVTRMADVLSSVGVATLAIDAQYAGERRMEKRSRGIIMPVSYLNRDAMIQTVIDLRRGLDFLETRRDIDAERIGFVGFSQGAMLGTAFCGIDKRVKTVCLVVGGGDFLNVLPALRNSDLSMRLSQIMDPVHYVGMIAPRPLLMLNGKQDIVVQRPATEALFNAAGQPKEIIWYDAGHIITTDSKRDPFIDLVAFFKRTLLTDKGSSPAAAAR